MCIGLGVKQTVTKEAVDISVDNDRHWSDD